jgi:hypothetical protein
VIRVASHRAAAQPKYQAQRKPNSHRLFKSLVTVHDLTSASAEANSTLHTNLSAGSVSDPAILATLSDGVLLVLDAQNTPKVSVRRSVRSLEAVGANYSRERHEQRCCVKVCRLGEPLEEGCYPAQR